MQALLNRPTAEALNQIPPTPDAAWRRSQEQQKEQKRWAGEPPRLLPLYNLRDILECRQSFRAGVVCFSGARLVWDRGMGLFGTLLPTLHFCRS